MKMLLIDGNSVLFRAFYATSNGPIMQSSNGTYTNAVYAFSNMLNKAIHMIHPEYCLVAFDKGKHNFRHEISKDYKANRKPTPIELVSQFPLVREFLSSYNIPYLEYDEIEGDDIIGSVSKKYPSVDVCILTSDKDMLQLLDDSTHVYFMKKGLSDIDCIDSTNLLDIWPVRPDQIIDLKALMGDKSDNIPGVSGIGIKMASSLLERYDTLDGIYEHIDELKGKMKERLVAEKDIAYMSRELATIKVDVEIEAELDDFKLNLDIDGVNEFYQKYDMRSLIIKNREVKKSDREYKRVNKISKDILSDGSIVYIDDDEFSYYEPKVYGLVLCNRQKAEYIPVEDLLLDSDTLDYLKDETKSKRVYGLKHILHVFDHKGLSLKGKIDDIMLMGFLKNNYLDSLATLFESYGIDLICSLSDIYGTIKKPKLIDTKIQTQRAIDVAMGLDSIYDDLKKSLTSDEMYDLYENVELQLSYVLYDMEKEGIRCDVGILNELGEELKKRIADETKEIYEYANHEFNINSTQQLAEVLFDELALPANKKRSTNVEELERLLMYHPIIEKIMQYRKDSKLLSTYIEGLAKFIKSDGKIHTIFSQAITQTGRLSSSEPNLQNIAVRDEDGKLIRKAFLASNNNILISSDYSQIELRVLSALANEEKMKEAFENNIDIHTKTAMDVFNLSKDEVDDAHRRKAKACNFGIIYGISDFGLAKQIGVSLNEARDFINNYFNTYTKVKAFQDSSIDYCEKNGYVKTILNRRRYIKEIRSNDYKTKEFGKRAAMNSVVQGSAADLIKVAMINIAKRIKDEGLKSKMVLQIHDELIFDVYSDEKEIMEKIIKEGMIKALDLGVKLDVSINEGKSWYEAK